MNVLVVLEAPNGDNDIPPDTFRVHSGAREVGVTPRVSGKTQARFKWPFFLWQSQKKEKANTPRGGHLEQGVDHIHKVVLDQGELLASQTLQNQTGRLDNLPRGKTNQENGVENWIFTRPHETQN